MDTKIVHVEYINVPSLLLRIGGSDFRYGDPYELSLVIIPRGKCAEVVGADKPVMPSHWRAIRETLANLEFEFAFFERRKEGNVLPKTFPLAEFKTE